MTAHTSSASRHTLTVQPAGVDLGNVRIDVTDMLAGSVLILVVVLLAMHALPVSFGLA